jgi:hypothetical protein
MQPEDSTFPRPGRARMVTVDTQPNPAERGTFVTRDHEVIKRWAARRHAEPATGEATCSGAASVDVADTGASVRFNFPGIGPFRPITWDEWLESFDQHEWIFIYEEQSAGSRTASNRYRIMKKAEWEEQHG